MFISGNFMIDLLSRDLTSAPPDLRLNYSICHSIISNLGKAHSKLTRIILSMQVGLGINKNSYSQSHLQNSWGRGSAQSSDSQGEHPIVLDFDCVFWS